MKYARFDPNTGRIICWGIIPKLPADAIQHNIEGSLAGYYVDLETLTLRRLPESDETPQPDA